MKDLTLWVDTIRNDKIVLTNGEYELDFEVVAPDDTVSSLPDVFRQATISDKFELTIELTEDS